MTNTAKIIATASTFGAIGGSSALAGYLLNNRPTELENRLNKEGFEILDINSAGGAWETVLTGYRAAKKHTFTNSPEPNKSEADLRKKCGEILREKAFKEENYLLARQWCVKKIKVSEILSKHHKLLDFKQDLEEERNAWTQNVEALKVAPDKFKNLRDKMKQIDEPKGTNVTTLKKECEELKKKENIDTTSEEFSGVFEQMRDYCSIKKNISNKLILR